MFLTILSGLFGGLLRLAPELLKFFDAKNDRAHELNMQDKALEFQKLTGSQKVDEILTKGNFDIQKAQFETYIAGFDNQSKLAQVGGKFVAAASAFVRPAITFFVFAMWASWKISVMIYAYQLSGNFVQVLINNWNQDDASMLTMIVSFWFVGRAIENKR